jgi:hypothetical protein
MRKYLLCILITALVGVGLMVSPASASTHKAQLTASRHITQSTVSNNPCGGSILTSVGSNPQLFTQWVSNPTNCQQRSKAVCVCRIFCGTSYHYGGWVYSTSVKSATNCDSSHPILGKGCWQDRIGPSGTVYTFCAYTGDRNTTRRA